MARPPHDVPAVVETRLVHDVHRHATTLLADAAARGAPAGPLAEVRDFVVATLHHHHTAEDTDLWPILLDVAPDLDADLATLTADHARLDAALDVLAEVPLAPWPEPHADAAARAAATVRDLVHAHLAAEEPVLFPALAERLPDGAWDGFSARTVASTPDTGKALLVGFLHELGDARAVEVVLRHVPPEGRAAVPAARAHTAATLAALDPAVVRP